jgi:hypothetical protein
MPPEGFNRSPTVVDDYKSRKRVRNGKHARVLNAGSTKTLRVRCVAFGAEVVRGILTINRRSTLLDVARLIKQRADAVIRANPPLFSDLQTTNLVTLMIQSVHVGHTIYDQPRQWRRSVGSACMLTRSVTIDVYH